MHKMSRKSEVNFISNELNIFDKSLQGLDSLLLFFRWWQRRCEMGSEEMGKETSQVLISFNYMKNGIKGKTVLKDN